MYRPIHFELPSNDFAASKAFYEKVFGWKIVSWEGGDEEYLLVTTGDDNEPGINGAIGGPANHVQGTVNTLDVENLDESLNKAVASGAQVFAPKMEIPGMGWVAYIREPGGALLGMFQVK